MSRPWVAGVFLAGSVPQFPQLCGAVMRRAYSLEFSEGQTRMAPAGFLHGVLRGSDLTGRRGWDRDLHLLFPERTLALGTSEPRPPPTGFQGLCGPGASTWASWVAGEARPDLA